MPKFVRSISWKNMSLVDILLAYLQKKCFYNKFLNNTVLLLSRTRERNWRYQIKTNAVVSTNCLFSLTMKLAKHTTTSSAPFCPPPLCPGPSHIKSWICPKLLDIVFLYFIVHYCLVYQKNQSKWSKGSAKSKLEMSNQKFQIWCPF